jgi:protein TonB
MYADRFDARRGIEPRSLALAIAINGAVVLAIATAQPDLVKKLIDPPLTTYPVTQQPDPKPLRPIRQPDPKPAPQHITPIKPIVTPPVTETIFRVPVDPLPPVGTDIGSVEGNGNGGAIDPPAKPSVLSATRIDQRFAGDLQPPYPPGERKMGREGRVTVRVLVGADGRVHDIQLVSATSDEFFDVTRRQALAKWRFRPATRDGVAVESWRRMSVSFRLEDE